MEGSVDLDKLPTRRVHQLAKKIKSSKATACHIKQASSDPQATQINLMQHQRTELPTNRYNKKRRTSSREKQYKTTKTQQSIMSRNPMTTRSHLELLTDATNVVTLIMCKDSNGLLENTKVSCATNMATSPVYATKRNLKCIIRIVVETLKCINYMQVPCMHKTVPITVIPQNPAVMNHFGYSYKHKATRLNVSRFHNLFI